MGFILNVLAGPTAVGKTELALAWAEQNGAEILSCDSLQLYRGMDIGSAKPSQADLSRCRHHGVDIAAVNEPYSVSKYVEYAKRVVADCAERNTALLITGGSGFYLKAFFFPVADQVVISSTIRQHVREWSEREGLPSLVARLRELNPDGLGDLAVQNPRRVEAALGRCLASGRTLRDLKQDFDSQASAFAAHPKRLVVLDRERDELATRIHLRTVSMLKAGLIEEVEHLLGCGLKANPSARSAIGYREVIAALECGRVDRDELSESISRNTLRLVKKQRSWFRNQMPKGLCLHPDHFFAGLGDFFER